MSKKQTQDYLNKITKWAGKKGFQFSKTKTVSLHFHDKEFLHSDSQLKMNDTVIPIVQQPKYLGFIYDNKLNFRGHVNYRR